MSVLYWLLGIDDPSSIRSAAEVSFCAARALPGLALTIAIVAGVLAAALNLLPQAVMAWRTRVALTLIRLAGFAMLIGMLAQLELRLTVDRELPARVAVLTDTSGSMGLKDAGQTSRLQAARDFAQGSLGALNGRASVSRYGFNWRLEPDAGTLEAAGATQLSTALLETARREPDLQAIVLLSDGSGAGTDGAGGTAGAALRWRGVPVFPVIFGKEDSPKTGRVQLTGGATYVRLGDELSLSAMLSAQNLAEQTVRAVLYEKGVAKALDVRENIRLGAQPVPVHFVVKPDRPGAKTYQIAMEGLRGAVTDRRMAAEQNVDVIDAKIRVLYLDIPRDERKVLGHWLARDPVVDLGALTLMPKGGWYAQGSLRHANQGDGLPSKEADLYQYDVVILGDIPRSYFRQGGDVAETKMRWLAEFVARRGGGLIALGGQKVYAAGGYQDSMLAHILPFEIATANSPQIEKTYAVTPTALGLAHPLMQLESNVTGTEAGATSRNREAWLDLPQLDGCNRVGAVRPGATLLAVRAVGGAGGAGLRAGRDAGTTVPASVPAEVPVIAMQELGKGKVLALAADTTWRWEMMRDEQAPDYFRRFWGNAVRHLAPDPRLEPGKPQIQRSREHAAVGETVTFTTRLVDAIYAPVRGADLAVQVRSPSGRTFMIFPRDGRNAPGVYAYDVLIDEPGSWSIQASYKKFTAEEIVRAGEGDEELDDPRARPDRLKELAKATGGEMYRPEQAAELLSNLSLKTHHVRQSYLVALWNLPVTMLMFVTLVCADCLIRKRKGMA
ncbi:MAG TPA: hypothetical protein VGP72_01275 [Planctomycetota bacterium]|jgi:hypothetical protein